MFLFSIITMFTACIATFSSCMEVEEPPEKKQQVTVEFRLSLRDTCINRAIQLIEAHSSSLLWKSENWILTGLPLLQLLSIVNQAKRNDLNENILGRTALTQNTDSLTMNQAHGSAVAASIIFAQIKLYNESLKGQKTPTIEQYEEYMQIYINNETNKYLQSSLQGYGFNPAIAAAYMPYVPPCNVAIMECAKLHENVNALISDTRVNWNKIKNVAQILYPTEKQKKQLFLKIKKEQA